VVKITIESKEFVADLKEVSEELFADVRAELQAAAIEARDTAVQSAPVDLGALKQSIRNTPEAPNQSSYQVVVPINYAAYQEFGTGSGYVPSSDPEVTELAATFRGAGIRQVNMKPQPYLIENTKKAFAKFLERIEKIKK
jgi:HK97 gp10 family phage protein